MREHLWLSMRIRRTVDTMVTAGARGQVCAVHSEASEDAGARL